MYALYVLAFFVGVIGCIAVEYGIKKRNIRQKQNAIDEWNRRVNALREVTEQAATEVLTLAGKTLRLSGMWFDVEARELHLPDVFWGLGPRSTAKALVTIFKVCVRENMLDDEPENSENNQKVINACIQGLMKALTSRARTDPKETLEVMHHLVAPGKSAEDSIHNLLSTKPSPK